MNPEPSEPPAPTVLVFVLAMPPGVNKLYKSQRTKRGSRIMKTEVSRDWAHRAQYDIDMQRAGAKLPYRFRALIVLPETAFDVDAPVKQLLDACQHGGAITNDKHCRAFSVEIDDTRPPGSVLVELTALPDIPPQPKQVRGKSVAQADLI